ncbi:MAG: Histone deacetylase hda1 [Bathelium mastoideum]|nr:MAG: Histone deacetylase hda1 [Bathelium mastoideum]
MDSSTEEEVQVLQSTELNGDFSTVDPSVFALDALQGKSLQSHDPAAGELLSPVLENGFASQQYLGVADLPGDGTPSPDYSNNGESDTMDVESVDSSLHEPRRMVSVLIPQTKFPPLPYASSRSGLVYDVRMRFHAEPMTSRQPDDIHPEDPRRIHEIYQELFDAQLVHDVTTDDSPNDFQMLRINAREATKDEILLVHERHHYEWVKELITKTDDELETIAAQADSIYAHKLTYNCAKLSAGGAIEACRAVVAGQVKNAFAVIRPPGHHAEPYQPGGFCFFNNVCIAARVCQRDFPETCRKILILDWDVHHGNGVQRAFYDDPNVLYISIHVHRDGRFYPCTNYGDHKHVGNEAGEGKNVNVPWPCHGMTDGDYLLAFQQVVMPIAQEFDPDLVIVSAGFDAAAGDELGQCYVTPAGYAHMTHMLMSLANGKVAVCLEGGYNLRSIAKSALAVTRTLMGEPPDRLSSIEPTAAGVETVQMVIHTQSRYWACLYPKVDESRAPAMIHKELHGERLHDIYRSYQSKEWWDNFEMAPLFIHRDRISKSFDREVLATSNYNEARPLLVVFHDPPNAQGLPSARTRKLELHNIWITDVAKSYVEWAIQNDFAVIDVNIPKHITAEDEDDAYADPDASNARAAATLELATYIWENYIEIYESTHVFLLGIGDAYLGLINLLSSQESCTDRVTFVISFVAETPLNRIRRATDEDMMARWFYDHSLIFVAGKHGLWERDRKPRKKFGKLVESAYDELNEMLVGHREQVTRLLERVTRDWRVQQPLESQIGR